MTTKCMLYKRLIYKYLLQKNVGTTPEGVAPTFRLQCVCNYKICICSDASNSAWISLLGS